MNLSRTHARLVARPSFSPLGAALVLLALFWLCVRTGETGTYLSFFAATAVAIVLPGYAIGRAARIIRARHDNWERLTAATAIGTGTIVLGLFALSFLGTPFLPQILGAYLASISGLAIWYLVRDVRTSHRPAFGTTPRDERITRWLSGALIWTIWIALVFVFLFPTRGLIVAPEHDPVQNSLMADRLVKGLMLHSALPKMSHWYPPGGSYLAAVVSWVSGVQAAKVVTLQTQFYNLMITASLAMFLRRWLSDRRAGVVGWVVYGMMSVAIASYFVVCGKNSQVIGDFLLFYCAALALDVFRRRDIGVKFVFMALLAAGVLIHFTLGFMIPGVLLLLLIQELIKHRSRFLTLTRRQLRRWPSWVLAASVCAVPLVFEIDVLRHDEFLGKTMIGSVEENYEEPAGIFNFDLINFKILKHEVYVETIAMRRMAIAGGLLALMTLVIGSRDAPGLPRRRRWERLFVLSLPLLLFFFIGMNNSFIRRYGTLYFFACVAVAACYCAYMLCAWSDRIGPRRWRNQAWWFLVVLFPFVVMGVGNLSRRYESSKKPKTYVTNADLKAFAWIKANVSPNEYILPASTGTIDMHRGENISIDASLYMKMFAEREDVIGFVGGDRFDHVELGYRKLYLQLLRNLRDQDVLRQFARDNIKYVFVGARTAPYAATDPEAFAQHPDIYQPIYADGRVKVYRIVLSE